MVKGMNRHTYIRRTLLTLLAALTLATLLIAGTAEAQAGPQKWQAKRQATKVVRQLKPWNRTHTRWRVEYRKAWRSMCAPGRLVVPRGVTVKRHRASAKQRRNLTSAIRTARRMRAPRNHLVALVAGMTQEATAHNKPYGHGTSVGILQLIDVHEPDGEGHDWRMHIPNSAGWFLRGARRLDPRGRAQLRTTPNRTGLIQRVQRSGHPYAYNQWLPEARRTVRRTLGQCSAVIR